jgi:hypothetical protein
MGGFGDDLKGFFDALAEDRKARMMGKEPQYVAFLKPSGDDAKATYNKSMGEAELRNYSGRLTLQSYQPTTLIDVTPFLPLIAPTQFDSSLPTRTFCLVNGKRTRQPKNPSL